MRKIRGCVPVGVEPVVPKSTGVKSALINFLIFAVTDISRYSLVNQNCPIFPSNLATSPVSPPTHTVPAVKSIVSFAIAVVTIFVSRTPSIKIWIT